MAEAGSQSFPGSRRLDLLCYALVWIGALSLLMVPNADPQMVLAFCLLIAPSCFLNVPAQKSGTYRAAWRFITVAFVVGSLLDWRLNGRAMEQTLVAQMCFFQAFKSYNTKSHTDYLQMVLFATLMIAFCGLVSDSVFFLIVLIPFVAVLVAFLRALNLSREYLVERPGGGSRRRRLTPGMGYQVRREHVQAGSLASSRLSWLAQTLTILAFGLAAFYILPRKHVYSPSHIARASDLNGRDPVISGLSVGVSLRHLSEIKEDPRPVVRVTFPNRLPPADSFYLRAGSLEQLSNHQWIAVGPRPILDRPDADGVFWFRHIEPEAMPSLIPHVVEFLNASGQVPLALPNLVAIDRVHMRSPPPRTGVITSLKSYRAYSWDPRSSGPPPVDPVNKRVWRESLDLPPELQSARIRRQAAQITYARDDNLRRAEAIERFLLSEFAYTRNIEPLNGPPGSQGPIERFLFEYRKGNCEVFASAMVVLCRNENIPARLAIGYHGGVQGDTPHEFIFRNKDAHTWVEVWSPETGWVTFDPTPPPPLEVYSGRFSFKKLMEWFSLATGKWNRMVVWYDNEAKVRWMSYLWDPIERWALDSQWHGNVLSRLAPRIRDNIKRPQILALLVTLVILNVAATLIYLKLRRRWAGGLDAAGRSRRRDPWQRFYCAAVDVLRSRPSRRLPNQTPREFLEALARECALDPALTQSVLRLYHQGRFGHVRWDHDVTREANHRLRQLARAVGHPAGRNFKDT